MPGTVLPVLRSANVFERSTESRTDGEGCLPERAGVNLSSTLQFVPPAIVGRMGNEVAHLQITDLDRFRRLFGSGGVDPELASMTASFVTPTDGRDLMRGRSASEWVPLAEFVEEMVGSVAPQPTWRLDLDRRFGRLASALGRAASGAEAEQLVHASVYGATELTLATSAGEQVAVGCQGLTQRVSTAEACRTLAEFLASLSLDAVARAADLAAMVEEGVYKAHPGSDAEAARSWVVKDFEALRAFYGEVATADRSVLVTRD